MPSTGGPSGHLKSKHYVDTRGLKVAGGEFVKAGTILTRQGNKWKAGNNVGDSGTLFALCDGKIYFTKRKSGMNRVKTHINILPVKSTKDKTAS